MWSLSDEFATDVGYLVDVGRVSGGIGEGRPLYLSVPHEEAQKIEEARRTAEIQDDDRSTSGSDSTADTSGSSSLDENQPVVSLPLCSAILLLTLVSLLAISS